ncbi:Ger(x)C family spore germination protein [Paenibacillus turpanensis]|uniref:Ger(x)C family spore germination protein n=1 Tax=Paenibacillus turpanensis TaxID=2689078 RepID=UPI0014080191|nr:Ger(x)C family spore germination protein [Paenibacillus turpanensis]
MRKIKIAALFLLCTALLTGCWDRTEINDIAIVLASSIDKEGDKYRVALEIPLAGKLGGPSGGGGGSGGEKSFYIDSEIGKTVRDADDRLQMRMSREIFLSHRRVIVVGEELAKAGIMDLLDSIPRVPENRLTAYMVVAEGSGFDVLKAEPKLERFSAEAIREIVKTGNYNTQNIKEIAQAINQPGVDPVLLLLRPKKSEKATQPSSEIEVVGYAQFKHDKWIATYHEETARAVNWLRNDIRSYVTTLQLKDSKEFASFRIREGETEIKVQPKGSSLHFSANVTVQASVLESYAKDELDETEVIRKYEEALTEHIQKGINSLFEQIKKHSADPAGFGRIVDQTYPMLWKQKYEKQWDELLPLCTFEANVKTRLVHVGQTSENIGERRDISE